MRPMRTSSRLLVTAAVVTGCSSPPKKQPAPVNEPQPTQTRVERDRAAIQKVLDEPTSSGRIRGLSVAVHRGGETLYFNAGVARVGGATPTADTVYEIGSITKTFTGLLLADAVARKEVALDQAARSLLPEGRSISDHQGKQITLEHLATHSSGLPRLPANLPMGNLSDPYADYTPALLYQAIARVPLASSPGDKVAYSNLGAGLLGHLLALRARVSYEALLRQRILDPLGMKDSAITLSKSLRARLAQGYDADGEARPPWHMRVLAGAGGLRSTARDTMRFVLAHMNLDHPGLAPAMRATLVSRKDRGDGGRIGLFWHIDKGVMWHNGGTGGYHSFAAFSPAKRAAVVVLANTASGLVDSVGVRLLKLIIEQGGRTIRPSRTGPKE
jgi:CubicO group peptidase (beta-lactamase class C family)